MEPVGAATSGRILIFALVGGRGRRRSARPSPATTSIPRSRAAADVRRYASLDVLAVLPERG